MTSVLAVLLPVLVVVGAFMWMQPSKRDQHLTRLRSEALVRGFRIDSLKVADTSEYGRVNQKNQIVTLYQRSCELNTSDGRGFTVQRTTGDSGINLPDGWTWEQRGTLNEHELQALKQILTSVPASVTLFHVRPDSVGLSWDEADDHISFDQLRDWLQTLAGHLNKVAR